MGRFNDEFVKQSSLDTFRLMFGENPNYADIEIALVKIFHALSIPVPKNIHDRAIALELFYYNQ